MLKPFNMSFDFLTWGCGGWLIINREKDISWLCEPWNLNRYALTNRFEFMNSHSLFYLNWGPENLLYFHLGKDPHSILALAQVQNAKWQQGSLGHCRGGSSFLWNKDQAPVSEGELKDHKGVKDKSSAGMWCPERILWSFPATHKWCGLQKPLKVLQEKFLDNAPIAVSLHLWRTFSPVLTA